MITGSVVNKVAHITSNASFFAPCGVIVPLNRCPPSIIKDSMLISSFYYEAEQALSHLSYQT